jgi:hypothetical protein
MGIVPAHIPKRNRATKLLNSQLSKEFSFPDGKFAGMETWILIAFAPSRALRATIGYSDDLQKLFKKTRRFLYGG